MQFLMCVPLAAVLACVPALFDFLFIDRSIPYRIIQGCILAAMHPGKGLGARNILSPALNAI